MNDLRNGLDGITWYMYSSRQDKYLDNKTRGNGSKGCNKKKKNPTLLLQFLTVSTMLISFESFSFSVSLFVLGTGHSIRKLYATLVGCTTMEGTQSVPHFLTLPWPVHVHCASSLLAAFLFHMCFTFMFHIQWVQPHICISPSFLDFIHMVQHHESGPMTSE